MTATPELLHSVTVPARTAIAGGNPLLIMLHGRGADETDLLPLAEYLDVRFSIAAFRAPFNFPYGGYTWYEILDESGTPDASMFRKGYDSLILSIQNAASQAGVPPSRTYLFGFSMGAMMAHAAALTRPELIAGYVANSGYIPPSSTVAYRWKESSGLKVLITHGAYDPVVPVLGGRRAKEKLVQNGIHPEYKEYPMGHEISMQSLGDIGTWLTHQLDK